LFNANIEDVILAVNSFNALEETNVDVLARDFPYRRMFNRGLPQCPRQDAVPKCLHPKEAPAG
jgi:hypothetical protein